MSKKSSSTTVSQTGPWAPQQSYLIDVFGKAKTAYNDVVAQNNYDGPVLADINGNQTGAVQSQIDLAKELMAQGNYGGNVINFGQDLASGKYLNPDSNSYFADAVQAAINPLIRNYQTNTMPALSDAAMSAGAWGGGRQGVADALGQEGINRQIADTTGTMYSNNYQNVLGLMMNSPALLEAGAKLNMLPSEQLLQAGNAQQALEQQRINAILAKQEYNINNAFAPLAQYKQLVDGNYGSTGSTTTTSKSGGMGSVLETAAGVGATLGAAYLTGGTSLFAQGAMGGGGIIGAGGSLNGGLTLPDTTLYSKLLGSLR